MSGNSIRASIFVRRAMEGKSNNIVDPVLSKIESKIRDIGSYVRQRYSEEDYQNLLDHICSEGYK